VGTPQLKNNAVTSARVKHHSLSSGNASITANGGASGGIDSAGGGGRVGSRGTAGSNGFVERLN
jgi:hypothetical protein